MYHIIKKYYIYFNIFSKTCTLYCKTNHILPLYASLKPCNPPNLSECLVMKKSTYKVDVLTYKSSQIK